MRRILATIVAAVVCATTLVMNTAPANAVNVRYRAAKSCETGGKTFSADIHTYGKPTSANPGVYTEVQLWGYKMESGASLKRVEAWYVVWRDGSWHVTTGIGYDVPGTANGKWHNGDINGKFMIGYLTPTNPTAVMVRAYTGPTSFCNVFLRPYDLYWVG
ncbi:hypothetical protein [Streptomyces sp. SID13031]|uniref:hypothetical protein n=1 Tax=Streptomyces sp. SID13031 TaxID=2706046 RepID=UPI0013C7D2BD|nr:hypothetical protein [Streptomyces sp. SID13031]NEA35027.1 hypothetical protein [Streptomyces sp. SID13031]